MLKLTKISIFKLLLICLLYSVTYNCSNSNVKILDIEVFRYNEHKNINSLDPAFSKDLADIWATHQLFNGLVQMNNELKVKPCIAKSWQITDSARVYTFSLRDDVYFHRHSLFGTDSTRKVTAKDFTYSFNRLRDPKLASPGSWVMQKVKNYQALNDSTFQVELHQAFPAFLGLLTMKYCSVVPEEIVSFYGAEFRSNPIGTGPFKFKRWEENIKLVLRRNPLYFERDSTGLQLPYLEAVAITFLPDKQSEFLQFAQGNIDFVSGLDASYKDELLTEIGQLQPKYKNEVRMLKSPYLNTEYLSFYLDSEEPEIKSSLLRKAVNIGFDRKKMITYLRNGIGIPADGGFIPKGLPGYSQSKNIVYNPDLAKSLIEQYKEESGNNNPELTLTTTSNYLSFCEFIQRELEKVGLNISIDVIPASSLKDAKANGKLAFFRASWVADYPDAENYLSLFSSENFAPNGPNYSHFSNNTFDELYGLAYNESDSDKRALIYKQLDSLVMSKNPVIPLFYDEVVRFSRKNVNGLGINPINLLELKSVIKN